MEVVKHGERAGVVDAHKVMCCPGCSCIYLATQEDLVETEDHIFLARCPECENVGIEVMPRSVGMGYFFEATMANLGENAKEATDDGTDS